MDWFSFSTENALWLDHPFSEEEIHNVVLHLNKAKGPDQRFKISGYILDISLIYTISVDPNTKFGKIYPSTNIFEYFIDIFSIF